VRQAASEVYGRPIPAPWLRWATYGSIAAAVALVGFGAWSLLSSRTGPTATASVTAPEATALATPSAETSPAILTAAPVATPPAERLDQLLVQHGNDTTTEAALGKLFGLWHLEYRANGGKGCDQAGSQGLECLFQKGSWAQLRTLNRPAVLTLTDDIGRTHQVVLTALTDETATIDLGGAVREVPITAMSRYWFGDFLLLWKPPMAVVKALAPGMRGADVRWLRESLRAAQGLPQAAGGNDLYDEDLTRLVQDFQRQHRLNVDGVAGVHTQIVLDTVLNATGSPTLGGAAAHQAEG
jgi:general secretion pathway protein A